MHRAAEDDSDGKLLQVTLHFWTVAMQAGCDYGSKDCSHQGEICSIICLSRDALGSNSPSASSGIHILHRFYCMGPCQLHTVAEQLGQAGHWGMHLFGLAGCTGWRRRQFALTLVGAPGTAKNPQTSLKFLAWFCSRLQTTNFASVIREAVLLDKIKLKHLL